MYFGYVTTIKDIRKHSNADRLQCVTVFGNNVIVDMSYHIGQRVVYFPVDGQLEKDFAEENGLVRKYDENNKNIGGYLDPVKRNIKAIKLRGEQSDGVLLPIEVLSKYVDIDTLHDGDKIDVLNGIVICQKYIPKIDKKSKSTSPKTKKNKKKKQEYVTYPFFAKHHDTEQLAYNQAAFRPGDICYITLKLHGTSGRTMNAIEVTKKKRNLVLKKVFKVGDKEIRRFKVISGTKRVTLEEYNGRYYGNNDFRRKYNDMFAKCLPKSMEVFYEIVGWIDKDMPIMGRCSNNLVNDKDFVKTYGDETIFSYGCDVGENDCYVYRMTMTNDDGYVVELPWEQVQKECEKMGVKCVPTFERFIYTTWDDLMQRVEKYYDGPDPIGKTHIREGVVVRIDNRDKFTAYKHKNFNFKVLSGIIADTTAANDSEKLGDDILSEL